MLWEGKPSLGPANLFYKGLSRVSSNLVQCQVYSALSYSPYMSEMRVLHVLHVLCTILARVHLAKPVENVKET